ncbi:cytochrome c-type biogenesis protein CcmH [Affinibrenneria salicis]|uniref:Cytochrome c-type biogenesis protein n=1 Tax=Affinibrenneria salicis TaxID=2590031 RepID=A0A5J5FUA3_9GAMM|nr:cytochrome c-type biogenesis protein [Affinibrenneria salicis]KAA8996942.1 cytochrome c-type biogenesis protein CcmH [Affinibrenneria salicis]
MKRIMLACLLLCAACGARAQQPAQEYAFDSQQQEQAFLHITGQLRCPKCQNSSISDSSADIARDMRAKVYQLMRQGKSQQEIIDYMVARYGYFVTWEPPVTPVTLILWFGPLALLCVGAGVIIRRARMRPAALTAHERRRLAQILPPTGGERDDESSGGRSR